MSVDFAIGACRNNSLARAFANELRLQGIDSNGDGEADRLEATATLEATDVLTGNTEQGRDLRAYRSPSTRVRVTRARQLRA